MRRPMPATTSTTPARTRTRASRPVFGSVPRALRGRRGGRGRRTSTASRCREPELPEPDDCPSRRSAAPASAAARRSRWSPTTRCSRARRAGARRARRAAAAERVRVLLVPRAPPAGRRQRRPARRPRSGRRRAARRSGGKRTARGDSLRTSRTTTVQPHQQVALRGSVPHAEIPTPHPAADRPRLDAPPGRRHRHEPVRAGLALDRVGPSRHGHRRLLPRRRAGLARPRPGWRSTAWAAG